LPRYIALLKNGFDAPPAVLLKQFLNIELLDGSLLSDDLELLNRRLDQLEPSASQSQKSGNVALAPLRPSRECK
jgi:hypothetical protein